MTVEYKVEVGHFFEKKASIESTQAEAGGFATAQKLKAAIWVLCRLSFPSLIETLKRSPVVEEKASFCGRSRWRAHIWRSGFTPVGLRDVRGHEGEVCSRG